MHFRNQVIILMLVFLASLLGHGQTTPATTKALGEALIFLEENASEFPNKRYVVLIDYGLPSTSERFYVYDTETKKIESQLVAHGRNSGLNYANRFSNEMGSFKSSLGFYRTRNVYSGKHGPSLVLEGLSDSNDNAVERAIVIHAADYVNHNLIPLQGRIGRSLGCPALNPRLAVPTINKIKGGSLIYAFSSASTAVTKTEPADKIKVKEQEN
jgi:hypothetical protein